MADNKLTYKGYEIILSIMSSAMGSDTVVVRIQKNNHTAIISRYPFIRGRRFDFDLYDGVVKEAKDIIDFIEVMAQEEAQKLIKAVESSVRYHTPLETEVAVETERPQDNLLDGSSDSVKDWFSNTDTSRFLK